MKETDFESLHTLLSNPDVMKYMEPPYTEEQTKEFLEYAMSDEPRVFTAEDDGKFIGYVIYGTYEEDTMELGWVLLPEYWNKGDASALTKLLMEKSAIFLKRYAVFFSLLPLVKSFYAAFPGSSFLRPVFFKDRKQQE